MIRKCFVLVPIAGLIAWGGIAQAGTLESVVEGLKALNTIPVRTFIVLTGLFLIVIGVVGSIAGKIEPDKPGRIGALVVGSILLLFGIVGLPGDETPSKPPVVVQPQQPEIPSKPPVVVQPQQPEIPSKPPVAVQPRQLEIPSKPPVVVQPRQPEIPSKPPVAEQPQPPDVNIDGILEKRTREYFSAWRHGQTNRILQFFDFPLEQFYSKANAGSSFVESQVNNDFGRWDKRYAKIVDVRHVGDTLFPMRYQNPNRVYV